MIIFNLPIQLRALADGRKSIDVEALNLQEALNRLDDAAPMIRSQVLDESGRVRPFVGIFVNSVQIEALCEHTHPLSPGSKISIVMAVAGG